MSPTGWASISSASRIGSGGGPPSPAITKSRSTVLSRSERMNTRSRAAAVLAAALSALFALTGCTSPKGPYGAEVFLRVHDTNGKPTYKAAGGEESPWQVMDTACPDGNPKIVDGSLNFTATNYNISSSYTVYFTCDHEIPIPPPRGAQ